MRSRYCRPAGARSPLARAGSRLHGWRGADGGRPVRQLPHMDGRHPPAHQHRRFALGGAMTDLVNAYHLMRTVAELRATLADELDAAVSAGTNDQGIRSHLLDAFLAAAGMNQIIEDHLHRQGRLAAKAASRLLRRPGSSRRLAAAGIAATDRAWQSLRTAARPGGIRQWQHSLARLVDGLSDALVASPELEDPDWTAQTAAGDLRAKTEELLGRVSDGGGLLSREVLRLPQCFFGFDQRPEDCRQLAEALRLPYPDRKAPLMVVGIRTSGSYLAPLTAAFLRRDGYRQTSAMTWRQGGRWSRSERRALLTLRDKGGLT